MSEISLSSDQNKVLNSLMIWFRENSSEYMTVGGYAGTGKTTLISIFRKQLYEDDKKVNVAFCAYTGKAARVLQGKLEDSKAIYGQDSVSTIHSLIYSPLVNDKEEIVGWERKDSLECDLIVIDEASMVDDLIWKDLTSYGIRIIAIGDHGQLPPIRGKFNLVESPMLRLEKIHRQAEGNPIIQLSIIAREEGRIPVIECSQSVRKFNSQDPEVSSFVDDLLMTYDENMLVLCGYNVTRVKLNMHIRQIFELNSPYPEPGDRVICLRNNHAIGIVNGMHGVIERLEDEDDDWFYAEIDLGEGVPIFKGLILKDQFGNTNSMNFTNKRSYTLKGDLFDFGYAVTVHKAQGSQSKRVLLFEERFSKMDDEMWRRWLYTGVTRAEEELYIIGRNDV